METPEWIAVVSVVVALVSIAVQQHLSRQQSKAEVRDRHYDRTQTLLMMALHDPELLEAISGASEEPQKQRRYRQLWFNLIEGFFRNRRLFDRRHLEGTMNDIRGFMTMSAMVGHWNEHRQFYSEDFADFMDQEVMGEVAEPSNAEAPPEEVQDSTT